MLKENEKTASSDSVLRFALQMTVGVDNETVPSFNPPLLSLSLYLSPLFSSQPRPVKLYNNGVNISKLFVSRCIQAQSQTDFIPTVPFRFVLGFNGA